MAVGHVIPVLTPDEAVRVLRGRELRVTQQRVTVLTVVSAGGHLRVDDVHERVEKLLGTVSLQAIYDVLATLSRAGLLNRIEPAGSPVRYEIRHGDNHHHFVCRECGDVEDVDCAVGTAPCLTPSPSAATTGFIVDRAEVTYWGLCVACQAPPLTTDQHATDQQPTDQHTNDQLTNDQHTNDQHTNDRQGVS